MPDTPKETEIPPISTGEELAETVLLLVATSDAPEDTACTICPLMVI